MAPAGHGGGETVTKKKPQRHREDGKPSLKFYI